MLFYSNVKKYFLIAYIHDPDQSMRNYKNYDNRNQY